MASPLTLENCLILACARTAPDVQRLQELVERGPDWPEILRKTERWGLAPLVYTHLRQAALSGHMPEPVAERLRHLYHRDTIHGVARRELLRATLLRFAEASIPVIVLKGAALATLVYPSPALRPMGDLDLLVHRDDRERVAAVLHSMRDTAGSPAGAGLDTHSGLPPLDPKRLVLLDVRDHIFSPHSSADGRPTFVGIPIDDFWERARPVQIESVATLVLSPEDLLLYLASNLTWTAGFVGQVRTLCDIGELCRRYGDVIAWRQLLARAHTYDMEKPLYYSLRLARELVEAGVPSGALKELRASFGQLPLEERVITAVARRALLTDNQDTRSLSKFYRLSMRLLATRRANDGVTVAYRHLAQAGQRRLQRFTSKPRPRRVRFTGGGLRGRLPATAIVLPIYRLRLEAEELAAVDRAFAVLRHGDWYLIAPQSLDTSFYEQHYGKPIVRFPDVYFSSVQSYSSLLLTDEFYAAFAKYEYMLITQDDVYVLRDDLPYWLSRRFDYIGAPWWPGGREIEISMSPRPGIQGHVLKAYVGNGGFSLRRIAACRQLLTEFREEAAWFSQTGRAEDYFFAFFGQLSQQFVLPNLRVAATFAWEVSLPHMHTLCQGQLPMAIHAYSKYDPEFFAHTILPAALSNGISAPADPSVARDKFQMHLPIKRKDHANLVAQLARVDAQLAHLNARINAVSDKREDHAKLVAQLAHVDAQLAHLNARINAVSDYLLALPSLATSVPIVAKLPVDIGAAHEICLFVSFAPAPTLKSHVRDHINSLVDQGIAVVLIVNTPHASEQLIIDADLVERLSGCLIRANSGFDIAAWAHAYSLLEIPQTCKRLYLVNDSLVGPLQPASYVSMIARIRGSTADLVGLTENSEPQPHLQSQFLVVTQRLLRSEVFGRLMRGIVNMPTKEGVIFQYETQITRFLRAHGFGCEAVFPRLRQGDDDTIHNWAQLIEQGFPFVRTQILEAMRDTSEAARLIPERYLTARH